ncbi:hypothetical protein D3C74_428130 [compost metagenome]
MSDTYYVQVKGNEFQEIEGQKVMIKDIECFIHKSLMDDNYWTITEAKSGMAVTQNFKFKKDAINDATRLIEKYHDNLKNQIAEMESAGKISPRYAQQPIATTFPY